MKSLKTLTEEFGIDRVRRAVATWYAEFCGTEHYADFDETTKSNEAWLFHLLMEVFTEAEKEAKTKNVKEEVA